MNFDKRKIEILKNNWKTYEGEILGLLEINRVEIPAYKAMEGTFVNAEYGLSFTIKDNVMKDPEGVQRQLSPKSQEEFFFEGIPTILQFFGESSIRICGQQIIPQWTETGTIYTKEG